LEESEMVRPRYQKEFEELGVEGVKQKLRAIAYSGEQKDHAEEWLRWKAQDAAELREDEQLSIARRALSIAEEAKVAAERASAAAERQATIAARALAIAIISAVITTAISTSALIIPLYRQ
jgi:hypothetical protein